MFFFKDLSARRGGAIFTAHGLWVVAGVIFGVTCGAVAQSYTDLNGQPFVNVPGVLGPNVQISVTDKIGTTAIVRESVPGPDRYAVVVKGSSSFNVWRIPDQLKLISGPIILPAWSVFGAVASRGSPASGDFVAVGTSVDVNGSGPNRAMVYSKGAPSLRELEVPTGTVVPQQPESRALGVSSSPAAPFGQLIVGSFARNLRCPDGSGFSYVERLAYGWPFLGTAPLAANFEFGKLLPMGMYCGATTYMNSEALAVSPNGHYVVIGANPSMPPSTSGRTPFDRIALVTVGGTIVYYKTLVQYGLPVSAEFETADVFDNGVVVVTAYDSINGNYFSLVIDSNGAAFVNNFQSPAPCVTRENSFSRGIVAISEQCPNGARVTLFSLATQTFSPISLATLFPNIIGGSFSAIAAAFPAFGAESPTGAVKIRN